MIQERDKLYTPTYKEDMLPGCMRQSYRSGSYRKDFISKNLKKNQIESNQRLFNQ